MNSYEETSWKRKNMIACRKCASKVVGEAPRIREVYRFDHGKIFNGEGGLSYTAKWESGRS